MKRSEQLSKSLEQVQEQLAQAEQACVKARGAYEVGAMRLALGTMKAEEVQVLESELARLEAEAERLRAAAARLPQEVAKELEAEKAAALTEAKKHLEELRVKARREAADFDKHARGCGEALARLRQLHEAGRVDAELLGVHNAPFVLRMVTIEAFLSYRLGVSWEPPSVAKLSLCERLGL